MPRALALRFASLALCVSGLLLGCRGAGAEKIVGPDGTPMLHVHCGGEQASCFRLAGKLCPRGYAMTPVFASREGNFLVSCREAAAPALAQCPAPSAPAVAAAQPNTALALGAGARVSSEGWPPASEPWPAAYPWPPPEASVSVSPGAPLPPTTRSETGQVDLGY